jgi:hypothetical protein
MRRRALASIVGLLVVVSAASAHAAVAADKKKAKSHYKLGLEYQKEGQYLQAADEYRAAYALTPRPELLYNIARAYQLGGDRKNATDYYQKFLDQVPEGEAADEARQFLAQMAREADEEERARKEEARRKQQEADEAEAKRKKQEQDAADAEARRKQEERDRQAAAAAPPPVTPPVAGSAVASPPAAGTVATPAAPPNRFRRLRGGLLGGIGISAMTSTPAVIAPDGEGNIPGFAAQGTADLQVWVTPSFLLRLDASVERRTVRFEDCAPCVPVADLQYTAVTFAVLPAFVLDPDGRVSLMIYAGAAVGKLVGGDWVSEQGMDVGMPLDASILVDAVGGLALRVRIGDRHLLLDVRGQQGTKYVLGEAHVKSISVLLGSTWGL